MIRESHDGGQLQPRASLRHSTTRMDTKLPNAVGAGADELHCLQVCHLMENFGAELAGPRSVTNQPSTHRPRKQCLTSHQTTAPYRIAVVDLLIGLYCHFSSLRRYLTDGYPTTKLEVEMP